MLKDREPPESPVTATRVPYTTRVRSVPPRHPRLHDPGRRSAVARRPARRDGERRGAAVRDGQPRLHLRRRAREAAGEAVREGLPARDRSEEHTTDLQSLMHISFAVCCLKKKKPTYQSNLRQNTT